MAPRSLKLCRVRKINFKKSKIGYRDGMGGTRDDVEGSEVRQGSGAEKVVRQIRQVGEPEPQNRDVRGGQDWSGAEGTGVWIGQADGGGDVGAMGTSVGISPHLFLTKEAGSIGGRTIRCASKEADRGAYERKYKVGTKCVFKHKVILRKLRQRFVEGHRNLVEDGAFLA